eukprot:1354762-Amorphochlora_amoeboformis.AAC.1
MYYTLDGFDTYDAERRCVEFDFRHQAKHAALHSQHLDLSGKMKITCHIPSICGCYLSMVS